MSARLHACVYHTDTRVACVQLYTQIPQGTRAHAVCVSTARSMVREPPSGVRESRAELGFYPVRLYS